MLRLALLILIFFFDVPTSKSQHLIFKEYVKRSQSSRDTFLKHVANRVTTESQCPGLSSLWEFENGKYYTGIDKTIIVLNKDCGIIDSISFEDPVIGFSVHGDTLVASVSRDEVEYYDGKIVVVDLATYNQRELLIGTGVMFGLNISDSGQEMSLVHQETPDGSQRLLVYNFIDDRVTVVDEHTPEAGLLGTPGMPAFSDWWNNCLYYVVDWNVETPKATVIMFDLNAGKRKKLIDLHSGYGLVFKVGGAGENIVLFKQENHKSRYIVSVQLDGAAEKVLYTSSGTLSDLDNFFYKE